MESAASRTSCPTISTATGGTWASTSARRPSSWLNENYAPALPNFSFDLVDVRNPRFHPDGSLRPGDAPFPYLRRRVRLRGRVRSLHAHGSGRRHRVLARERSRPAAGRSSGPDVHGDLRRCEAWRGMPVGTSSRLATGSYSRFPDREGWSLGYHDRLIREMVGAAGFDVDQNIEGDWHHPWVKPGPGPHHGCDLYVLSRSDSQVTTTRDRHRAEDRDGRPEPRPRTESAGDARDGMGRVPAAPRRAAGGRGVPRGAVPRGESDASRAATSASTCSSCCRATSSRSCCCATCAATGCDPVRSVLLAPVPAACCRPRSSR